jgi:hypothetical protein
MRKLTGHAFASTLVVMGLCSSSTAQAAATSCSTRIAATYVHAAGYVYADFGGAGGAGVALICNLNATMVGNGVGTISPDVCKGWLSMMLTAKSTQQSVYFTVDYGEGNPAPTSCVGILGPIWTVPPRFPSYFGLAN